MIKKEKTEKTQDKRKQNLLNPASLLEVLFYLLTVLKGAEGFRLCILCVHTLILQWGRFGRRRVGVIWKTLIFFVNAAADSSKFQFIVDFLQYFCNVMLCALKLYTSLGEQRALGGVLDTLTPKCYHWFCCSELRWVNASIPNISLL